jgi:hypothetical protein
MMISLTPEQRRAYERYITARNKMGIGKRAKKWIRQADVLSTVDLMGFNHPFFEDNPDYREYKEAFLAWLAIEPFIREEERMRMSRGDYGIEDSWEDRDRVKVDSFNKIKEQ